MANGKIETFEELKDVLLKVPFSSYKPGKMSGLLYGTLKRLRESGVSAGKLDSLLVDAGIKAYGNLARYIKNGEKRNKGPEFGGDEFALEHYLGMEPEKWERFVVPNLLAAKTANGEENER